MKLQPIARFFCTVIVVILASTTLAPTAQAQALDGFNYNYLLSDSDLTDYQSLTLEQVQRFLERRGSPLASYVDPVTRMSASSIIYKSAQDFSISPKFLLALIQKEQSLVEDSSPAASQFDWATGYAVCDSCNTNDPLIQKFKGFYNQVYNAAKRISLSYLNDLRQTGATASGFGPGITKQVDGIAVTPANYATAALYTYTPHLHGNRLFSTVWGKYFSRSYPDGSVVRNDDGNLWLIDNGARRLFTNSSVFLSYYPNFDKVLRINPSELEKYSEGSTIRFPNYSFLQVPRGTVYLLANDVLRGFASREALRRVGVNPEEILKVAEDDVATYTQGEPITEQSSSVMGNLMQDRKTGGVYFVSDGKKHPIWSRELMVARFGKRKPLPKTSQELDGYITAEPVLFQDGELIKAKDNPTVYLISHSERRAFPNLETFSSLGFSEKNIISVPTPVLELHALGEAIPETL